MSAFNQNNINNNNNLPTFPNNQNFMFLPPLNNQLNQAQIPQNHVDTNSLLKNLISQLQVQPQATEITNQIKDIKVNHKKNLRNIK